MRWCARCRDPELRRRHGLRDPLALPAGLEAALAGAPERTTLAKPGGHGLPAADATPARLHVFDPASQCAPTCPAFRGVRLYPDALARDEADSLLEQIEARPFTPSQSGKLKQHFGARFNFMRRRMNAERFAGLPAYASGLEHRLRTLVAADRTGDPGSLADARRALENYQTTDVFVLRYLEHEQSNLDFHVDDCFAYGEAIVDLSLDSDSVLSFLGPARPERGEPGLECVRVPLPARSLALVYGPARFEWQHAILPRDIRGVRTSITLRTLAETLRETDAGRALLARASGPAID
ncbi:MAG: alpha-ketoglutarate-dependent dioxygenase AlkB [Deltaproteobacteria bacterium]|nr:alpha-ketoglutarate-dependent dioxygenase AlkB [Deltaproteobacteria bacterium]